MAPVRLYYITADGTAHTIQLDVDEVLSEDEYFLRWANAIDTHPAYAKERVAGPTMVFHTDRADSGCRVKGGESPWDSMRRAVRFMPESAPFAVLFVGAADWNTTQFIVAHEIVKEQYVKAAVARVPTLEDKLAGAKSTTTKKPVRVYMCHSRGQSAMVEYHPDDVAVDNERAKDVFKRQLPGLDAGWFVVPRTIAVPGEEQGVNHYDDLLERPGFAGALNRAITLAACCCPNRAPYSIAFLRGYGTPSATQIAKEWRASFSGKYMPVRLGAMITPLDPLMEWYTLNKQAKATKEALLAKLRAALIEKVKDPALNPTGAQFDDTAESLLGVLSASTDNIAFIGAPARFAAYEACGMRFGPVLAASLLRLSTLDPAGTIEQHVRMTDLPWVSKEQK